MNGLTRRFIGSALVYSGIAAAWRRLVSNRGRFVLTFHGIACRTYADIPKEAQPCLTRDDLDACLGWIGKRFRFLTPDELLEETTPGVLLTFDDGFANNAEQALPILERHQSPAVFFVTTQHVLDPKRWLPATIEQARHGWQDTAGVPREIAGDLYDGMTREQLKRCAEHPLITIGSHSVSHPFLSRCTDGEIDEELVESKRTLEALTEKAVDLLAYPTGDYDRRVIEAARRAGYRAAFVEDSRSLGDSNYEIPRIGLYASDEIYLSLKLSGLHRRPVPIGVRAPKAQDEV